MTDTQTSLNEAVKLALREYGLDTSEVLLISGNGVSHTHYKIGSSPWILRVPRLSQMNLSPIDQLLLQEAAFKRAEASGMTPKFLATIPISELLPLGALIVERIEGIPPPGPTALPSLSRCLAAIHSQPLPALIKRAPIQSPKNPLAVIAHQAKDTLSAYMPQTNIGQKARDEINSRLNTVLKMAEENVDLLPEALCVSDTHPGNFIMRSPDDACFVDLEKPVYGCPALDLAHTVIQVAAGWDPDAAMSPNKQDRDAFTQAWLERVPEKMAEANAPRIKPFRQAVWLRTIGFFMRWKKESTLSGAWSAERLGPGAAEHFRKHVDNSLADEAIMNASEAWLD
ncbi:MAG: aminoglycoside phosphotransferase family protein [Rhodospirillales bacterium]